VTFRFHNFSALFEASGYALAFLVGLPFFFFLLKRFHLQRGLGPTFDGAWPDVCWGRDGDGFLALAGFILLQTAVGYLTSALLHSWLPPDADLHADAGRYAITFTLAMTANWVVVCGLSLLGLRLWRRANFAALGLSFRRLPAALAAAGKTFLAVLPLTTGLALLARLVYVHLTHHAPPEHPILEAVAKRPPAADVAVLVALAVLVIPFFEELFFRGLIQTTLMRLGRPWLAILISALVFGFAHSGVPQTVPTIFVLGLALGFVFYRTRSLAASFALHALFNLFNLALAILPEMLR
jgi:membrane protease YdiL (CAAX protease family)